MHRFQSLFNKHKCSVIGMVHLDALPGTPCYGGSVQKIVDKALKETDIYINCNLDGILIENMNDIPYVQAKHFTPETTAVMTRVCSEIKYKLGDFKMPLGVQVLAGGNKEALAIAKTCDFDFVRVEGFVFSHVADEGFTDANAGQILRYRKQIEAESILIFTDIKKKHSSHSITADVSLVETAKAAEYFLSDGLILTGSATGDPANQNELFDLKSNVSLPILIGSGVTEQNLDKYTNADALIIGSHFKENRSWRNGIDLSVVKSFMSKIRAI